MKLCLKGHSYRYAAEQIMATLLPDEKPEICEEIQREWDNWALIELTCRGVREIFITTLRQKGRETVGMHERLRAPAEEEPVCHRMRQKSLKLSFYRAAVSLTGETPPWGALTGIRPARILTRLLQEGMDEAEAVAVMTEEYAVTPRRARMCLPAANASIQAERRLKSDEISLYVGIPFCPTRCAYCSFVTATVARTLPMVEEYVEALCGEIALMASTVRSLGLYIKTLYMGGGTPTVLTASQLHRLMTTLEEQFDFSRLAEYTVEAGRPDTVCAEKFDVLKAHGVTRISINPQSMSPAVLRAIGRNHTPEDVARAMEWAKRAAFAHINMDLIAGLPCDTETQFHHTLDACLAMEPDNLTLHTLALKKGAALLKDRTPLPAAHVVARMLDYAAQRLDGLGWTPYYLYRQKYMAGSFENVGWCRPGAESLYNICMMEELHTVLGIGAGASTKLVEPNTGRIERYFHCKYAKEYMERPEKWARNSAHVEAFTRDLIKRGKIVIQTAHD